MSGTNGEGGADERVRRAEARAEAAELELERAHRLLDRIGVPREMREAGERRALELSLEHRVELVLEDDEADD